VGTAVLVRVLDEHLPRRKDTQPMSPIHAVWFDVGEVLIDETHEYGTWADWLGIPRHTFSAMFGAVIARGGLPPGVPVLSARLRP
jgi:hypothetical protein